MGAHGDQREVEDEEAGDDRPEQHGVQQDFRLHQLACHHRTQSQQDPGTDHHGHRGRVQVDGNRLRAREPVTQEQGPEPQDERQHQDRREQQQRVGQHPLAGCRRDPRDLDQDPQNRHPEDDSAEFAIDPRRAQP